MLYKVLYIGKWMRLQCALLCMAGHIGICGWLVSSDVGLQYTAHVMSVVEYE